VPWPTWGLQDGIAEDERGDGRPSGSDSLANPGDSTTGEPDLFDKAARLTADLARHVLEHDSTVWPGEETRVNLRSVAGQRLDQYSPPSALIGQSNTTPRLPHQDS
jgi:hypothetical protein